MRPSNVPAPDERALRRARGGAPRLIGHALPAVIDRLGIAGALEDARVFADWEAAVGPEIARVARPHRLDGGTLIVQVRSSAWMNELSLRRAEILRRVNGGRSRRVSQILFRLEG